MQRRLLSVKLGIYGALVTVLSLSAGCDEQLRTAVEDGFITSSTSFLAAFFRAALNVALDPNAG